jgi:hypothetical protein
MKRHQSYMFAALLLVAPFAAFAGDPSGMNKTSGWATNCEDEKYSRWFLMDEAEGAKFKILFGNSIKVTPYPGLHDIKDLRNDPRIEWLSEDKISVSNPRRPPVGWDGGMIFHRCYPHR